MSYSFSVTAANKAAAKEAVRVKFDEMVASQPIHARDRNAALSNAIAAIDALVDDDAMHVSVSMSGSVGWRDTLTAACDNPLTACSISAHAYLVKPEAA
ncbi:hypothetical protein JQ594_15655 [Bradyrhizobium manausense]|uniref:hypothetical protein n=1 Tax=Bradyrhizobium manausense TaxID=989370 RepID=UPI001BADBB7A|nr:hypothetical protein [Bradyrhizobium manausense]MBR0687367.1 hypothetical protein [Bradyrhizobium manausense]